ncbi:hypothetical protein VPH35_140030 [Triticum aestivum]
MVSDTPDRLNPFAPIDDPTSAAMADGPGSPPSHVADGSGAPVAVDPPQPPPPTLLPAGPIAPVPFAGPIAAVPTTTVLPSVLQTIDIRRHVPVTLDLLAGNYAQWRRHFDTAIGMFGLRDHVDAAAVPRFDDLDWAMADHAVVHWLNATVAPDLLDAVMSDEDTALTVWTAIDGIFRDNQLARAVYIDVEYHAVVQGDMPVMQYCTKLKMYADQLRDLGQPVSESRQVFHLLRGLNSRYHGIIPHITSQSSLPSLLQTRSFLLLVEHRAEQTARLQGAHALVAGRGAASSPIPAPAAPLAASPAPPDVNNEGRARGGRGRRRGRGTGPAGAPLAPQPPRVPGLPVPAAGANSLTGLVQARRAPGSGVLGPRSRTPHQQAMYAAPSPLAPGAPGYQYGYAPPPVYNNTPPGVPQQPLDMHSLQAALHSATAGPSSSGGSSEWYMDSGAAAHMTHSPGSPNPSGDPAL